MAKGRIEASQVVSPKLQETFDSYKQGLVDIIDTTEKLIAINKTLKDSIGSATGLTKLNQEVAKMQESIKKLQEQKKKSVEINKKLAFQTDEEVKAKIKFNEANKRQREGIKAKITLEEKEGQTIAKLNARNSQLRASQKNVTFETKAGRAELKRINAELDRNNVLITKNSDKLLKQKRNIGNYKSAMAGATKVMGALGFAGGLALVAKALKAGIEIIAKFNKTMSEVQAITGASGDSLEALRNSAERLGSTTKFTATQVGQLQVEYGRLGFTTAEILKATKATLDLAAATNTDLAQAAEVAGSTVRAFGFSAAQTQRVVDVMASSFASTALNLERFSTAMATVGPVAKNANVSLERTTSLLGVLVNRGIDASTAGTALRNIFLELSKQGLTYEEAMGKINGAVDKNAVAFDLFGKRGATVAAVLASTATEADNLTESLKNVDGAANKMATTMQDNLTGDVTRLNSAWEGLVLTTGQSGNVFREAVKFFHNLVLSLSNFGLGFKRTSKLTQDESAKLFDFWTNRAGKDADALKSILKEYSDFGINRLDQLKKDFIEEVKTTGINKKKSLVIFEEFRKRRLQQLNDISAANKEAAELESKRLGNEKILNAEKTAAAAKEQAKLNAKQSVKDLELKKKNAQKQREVMAKMNSDILKDSEAAEKEFIDSMDGNLDEILALVDSFEQERLTLIETSRANELLFLEQQYQAGLITREELEEKSAQVSIEKNKELLQAQIDLIKGNLRAKESLGEEDLEAQKELAEKELELSQMVSDGKIEDLEKTHEKQKALQADLIELANITGSAVFDIFQNNLDKQSQQLVTQKEYELKLAGENEEAREKIEEKFAAKQAALKTKQAKLEKAQALFSIGINTAIAVTSITAKAVLASPLLIPLIIASGLAQAAVVISKPIPKFGTGTDSSPEGWAEVGETGTELMIDPSGKIGLATESTMAYLDKGTKVLNPAKTSQVFKEASVMNALGTTMNENNGMVQLLLDEIKKGNSDIKRAVQNQSHFNVNISEGRAEIQRRKGQNYTNYHSRKFSN